MAMAVSKSKAWPWKRAKANKNEEESSKRDERKIESLPSLNLDESIDINGLLMSNDSALKSNGSSVLFSDEERELAAESNSDAQAILQDVRHIADLANRQNSPIPVHSPRNIKTHSKIVTNKRSPFFGMNRRGLVIVEQRDDEDFEDSIYVSEPMLMFDDTEKAKMLKDLGVANNKPTASQQVVKPAAQRAVGHQVKHPTTTRQSAQQQPARQQPVAAQQPAKQQPVVAQQPAKQQPVVQQQTRQQVRKPVEPPARPPVRQQPVAQKSVRPAGKQAVQQQQQSARQPTRQPAEPPAQQLAPPPPPPVIPPPPPPPPPRVQTSVPTPVQQQSIHPPAHPPAEQLTRSIGHVRPATQTSAEGLASQKSQPITTKEEEKKKDAEGTKNGAPPSRWSPFQSSMLPHASVCNQCRQKMKKSGFCIKEYPFGYSDKATNIFYHEECYIARIESEIEMSQVHSEFMIICDALRSAKKKSRARDKIASSSTSEVRDVKPDEEKKQVKEIAPAETVMKREVPSQLEQLQKALARLASPQEEEKPLQPPPPPPPPLQEIVPLSIPELGDILVGPSSKKKRRKKNESRSKRERKETINPYIDSTTKPKNDFKSRTQHKRDDIESNKRLKKYAELATKPKKDGDSKTRQKKDIYSHARPEKTNKLNGKPKKTNVLKAKPPKMIDSRTTKPKKDVEKPKYSKKVTNKRSADALSVASKRATKSGRSPRKSADAVSVASKATTKSGRSSSQKSADALSVASRGTTKSGRSTQKSADTVSVASKTTTKSGRSTQNPTQKPARRGLFSFGRGRRAAKPKKKTIIKKVTTKTTSKQSSADKLKLEGRAFTNPMRRNWNEKYSDIQYQDQRDENEDPRDDDEERDYSVRIASPSRLILYDDVGNAKSESIDRFKRRQHRPSQKRQAERRHDYISSSDDESDSYSVSESSSEEDSESYISTSESFSSAGSSSSYADSIDESSESYSQRNRRDRHRVSSSSHGRGRFPITFEIRSKSDRARGGGSSRGERSRDYPPRGGSERGERRISPDDDYRRSSRQTVSERGERRSFRDDEKILLGGSTHSRRRDEGSSHSRRSPSHGIRDEGTRSRRLSSSSGHRDDRAGSSHSRRSSSGEFRDDAVSRSSAHSRGSSSRRAGRTADMTTTSSGSRRQVRTMRGDDASTIAESKMSSVVLKPSQIVNANKSLRSKAGVTNEKGQQQPAKSKPNGGLSSFFGFASKW